MRASGTQRRKTAEKQNMLEFSAPSHVGVSAENAHDSTSPDGAKDHSPGQRPGNPANQNPSRPGGAEDTELPEGWQWSAISELARTFTGGTPSREHPEYFGGSIRWTKSGELNDGVLRDTEETITDVGLAKSNTKKCSEAAINQAICAIVPNREANSEFLMYALMHRRTALLGQRYGGAQPNISQTVLRAFELPIPPLPEQRAIAAVLRTVQGAKEACERVLDATRQLKQSLLHHLFTYGLVPFPQADQVELRQTDFGDVPASWAARLLSDCAHVQTGVAKGRDWEASDVVELPYLRVANVQDGRLDLTEMKTIQLRQREVDRFLLQPGDVVLTEGGDFDKLGRGFIWQGQVSPCVHQNHIFAVRANRAKLLPEYLAFLAQSSYGKAYFLSVAHKTTNLACINTTKLKALPVLLPPLHEQREIAQQLAAVDAKLAALESRRAALAALFNSLLHHLMTARLRLPEFAEPKRE
jgi:restriction endonuclease S subunit